MASQTIQDVKAIYAAAKAKLDSLPEDNKLRVQIFFHQCILAGGIFLILVFALPWVQLYAERKVAEEVGREFVQNRRLTETFFKENQRLQKELDSKKP